MYVNASMKSIFEEEHVSTCRYWSSWWDFLEDSATAYLSLGILQGGSLPLIDLHLRYTPVVASYRYPGRVGGKKWTGINCLCMCDRFRNVSVKLYCLHSLRTWNNIQTRYSKLVYV